MRITLAMTTNPTPMCVPEPATVPATSKHQALLVAEDWLLAAWVALVTPLLFRAQGGSGPFDSGAPLLGVIRLGAVLGALICVSGKHDPNAPRERSLIGVGAIGPLTGGLLLVAISGFTALSITSDAGVALVAVAALAMIAVHVLLPPMSIVARRVLVTPFVMVAGGLFWTFIAAVTGEPGSATPAAAIANPQTALAAIAFLLAFSAVYYAMLVYAPRQVAEREGNLVTWVLRYALFVAGVIFGLAWPRLFGV